MGIKDSAKHYAGVLRMDRHHTIERFGVMFFAITASFVLLLTATIGSATANNRAALDERVVYTPTFVTSKTQIGGEVNGVYTSSDGRRAMVLMEFSDALEGGFSADAQEYQAFVTGSDTELNDEDVATDITGQVVVFGTTGHVGVLLNSDEPFEQQILNLTVRANAELTYTEQTQALREDLESDSSFTEFDQWRLFLNPGATDAVVSKALDGRFDPTDFYAEQVVAGDEELVRKEMDSQLQVMRTDLARIEESSTEMSRANVDGVRIVPPRVPREIAGDEITGEPGTEAEPSTLRLRPKWTDPRGFNFDWRSGSVAQGYLDDLVPDGESYVAYLAKKSAVTGDDGSGADSGAEDFQVNDIIWELTDGTDLRTDYTESDATMAPLKDVMNNLSQAYQSYYQHKEDFQVDAYGALVNLEVGLRNVDSSYTVNDAKSALLVY